MSVSHLEAQPRARGALRRRWIRLVGVVAMCIPATQCLRNDEVDCEEAAKYMADCCPGFDPRSIQCEYNSTCGVSYPDLTPGESSCILGTSCDDLRRQGICDRVRRRSSDAGDPETPAGLGGDICP